MKLGVFSEGDRDGRIRVDCLCLVSFNQQRGEILVVGRVRRRTKQENKRCLMDGRGFRDSVRDGHGDAHDLTKRSSYRPIIIIIILSLVLSFVIITKHVIIMISSWRSWQMFLLSFPKTSPLRRLKQSESRLPFSSFSFSPTTTPPTSPPLAPSLVFCRHKKLCSLGHSHSLCCDDGVTSASFFFPSHTTSFFFLPSFTLYNSFFFFPIIILSSFETAEVARWWSMNRGFHYGTRRQKRVAHHAHGCSLHGQPASTS